MSAIAADAKAADTGAQRRVRERHPQRHAPLALSAATRDEHDFVVKAREFAKTHNLTNALEAQARCRHGGRQNPLLYEDYRLSLASSN